MPTPNFTTEILAAAITGFEQQRSTLDAKIAELKAMMAGSHTSQTVATSAPAQSAAKTAPKRKKMSAAARKRIGDAVRKAALAKKAAEAQPQAAAAPKTTAPKPATPKTKPATKKAKRKISAEGLKRIIEANKKRWALKKAAAKKA